MKHKNTAPRFCPTQEDATRELIAIQERKRALERVKDAASDLLAVAKAYEAWEAKLIINNRWDGKDGMPTLTIAEYRELMDLQTARNAAIAKAE